eukprot:1107862-Amphidinium_carterae.1
MPPAALWYPDHFTPRVFTKPAEARLAFVYVNISPRPMFGSILRNSLVSWQQVRVVASRLVLHGLCKKRQCIWSRQGAILSQDWQLVELIVRF